MQNIKEEIDLKVDQIIQKAKEVIRIENNAVHSLLDRIDDEFAKAVRVIADSKGRVVLTGMGKSGLIARKIVATLNSTGTAAIYLHPTDALHGDLGMVRREDVVILISKSGDTEEIINLIPLLKRLNVILIVMVGIRDSLAIALLDYKGFTEEDFALLHPGGSLGKRLSLRISEIMVKDNAIPVVNQNSSLKDAILEITSKRLGVTSVVDESKKLVGIITDGDLRRLLEKTPEIRNLKASDVMSRNPKTIKITSLVVIDEGNKPIGFIHLHELVKLGLQAR
jgi:arabinose-5-phosphate isomerase